MILDPARAIPSALLRRAAYLSVAFWIGLSAAQGREPWITFKDCRIVPNVSSDADSFHVKAGGKEYIFRLYFVDAPETEADFPERVEEQAKYFKLNEGQTLQLGGYAKAFTKEKLSRPFVVRTCMQGALGRSKMKRFYAFIETHEGDLAELLVANGLARVHGSGAQPVGLSSPEREWDKLERLEREAQQKKVGGWGAASGRMTARLGKQPPKSGPDSFDAFFHPERTAAAEPVATASPAPALTPAPSPVLRSAAPPPSPSLPGTSVAASRLDPNTASPGELQKLPGIGPVLAGRIIAARPFQTSDELRRVRGIGPKKYKKIRPHFQ